MGVSRSSPPSVARHENSNLGGGVGLLELGVRTEVVMGAAVIVDLRVDVGGPSVRVAITQTLLKLPVPWGTPPSAMHASSDTHTPACSTARFLH